MSKSYKEQAEDLYRILEPQIEEDRKYYEELPVGTKKWTPCTGVDPGGETSRTKTGHVGVVETYIGNGQWSSGEWITEEEAEERGLRKSTSHLTCDNCAKIIDEE